MKTAYFLVGLLIFISMPLQAEIKTQVIEYSGESEEVILKGYLAYDDKITGKRPGVLVVHEWWGHNDYARKRARMLAELGYTALAVDMYGEGKTAEHPKEAVKFMKAVTDNMETGKARFMAALALLKKQVTVDAEKTAAIGYCFGGGMVLAMARQGIELNGVASFHGSLGTETPAKIGDIKTEILVFNGEADKMSPPEKVQAFKDEMDNAKVSYELINYPGVKHSFTNPVADEFAKKFDLPLGYDEKADKDSWQKLQDFFKRIFAKS